MTNQIYDGALQDQLISQYPNILNADEIKTVANDFLNIIREGLKKDKQVRINKFGTFRIKKVNDRQGVNPQTGEKLIIKAHNRVFFKPTKALLERINSSVLLNVKNAVNDSAKYKVAAKQIDNVAQLVIKEETILTKPEEKDNRSVIAASLIVGIVLAGVIYQFQQPVSKTAFIPKAVVSSSVTSNEMINRSESQNTLANNGLELPITNGSSNLDAGSTIPPIVTSSTFGQAQQNTAEEELFEESMVDEVLSEEDTALYDDVMYDEALATNERDIFEESAITPTAQTTTNVSISTKNGLTVNEKLVTAKAKPFFAKKTYKLKYGDNLWNLAKASYKAPILWPHIYHDNQALIKNPNRLKTNKNIIIPQLDGQYGSLSDSDKRNVAEGYWLLYEHYKKSGNQFSTFALLGVKQFDSSVLESNKRMISKQDMADFLAMAEA